MEIRYLLRILKAHWKFILATSIAGFFAGLADTYILLEEYEATTTILSRGGSPKPSCRDGNTNPCSPVQALQLLIGNVTGTDHSACSWSEWILSWSLCPSHMS
jgi:hypothetical protein